LIFIPFFTYLFSSGNYPNVFIDFFKEYSDKFQFLKASDIFIGYASVNFLMKYVLKSQNRRFLFFLITSGLLLPLLLFASRGSFLGVLIYIYDMTRQSSTGYGPESVKAKTHGKGPVVSFGEIWRFESNEIQTAIKWENQKGFFEAITIYKNLKRLGDVNRVERSHIKYKRDLFVSKLSELKSKGIDCTNLENSSSNLNKALTDYFNIKDDQ